VIEQLSGFASIVIILAGQIDPADHVTIVTQLEKHDSAACHILPIATDAKAHWGYCNPGEEQPIFQLGRHSIPSGAS